MSQNSSCNLICKITVFLLAKSGNPTRDGKENGWREAELAGGGQKQNTMSGTTGFKMGEEGQWFGSHWTIFHSCHGRPKPRQKGRKQVKHVCDLLLPLVGSWCFQVFPPPYSTQRPALSRQGQYWSSKSPWGQPYSWAKASCLLKLFIQLSSSFKKGWSMLQFYLHIYIWK